MRMLSLGLTLFFGGCLYGDYNDVESEAPIDFFQVESYPRVEGFGRVLRSFGEEAPARSRLVASAGPGSPHAVFEVWNGNDQGDRNPIFDGCNSDCDEGSGADYAAIGSWRGSEGCFIIGSQVQSDRTQDGRLRIQCESASESVLIATGRTGERLGASLAPLGALGAAIVGAPGGRGGLYFLADGGENVEALTLPPALDLSATAALGTELATFDVPSAGELSDAAIILAAAPGMERVVAFIVGTDSTGMRALETVACIDGVDVRSPSDLVPEGGGLALVDVDSDGRPEALIGDPRMDRVLHVPLDGLGDGAGCADTSPDVHPGTREFRCSDMPPDARVVCDGLGSSVAAGDFDGDGDTDLVLGAAMSNVDNAVSAGALYVLPNASGFDAGAAQVLSLSSAAAGAELGARVVVTQTGLGTTPRDEPVASAPGSNRVYIFFCTGLPGDASTEGGRCLGVL